MKKTLFAICLLVTGSAAIAQNQPDSIHIVLHENQNGNIRVLDTIVPISQQQALFTWMQANGWEAPPPPPSPGQGPAHFNHEIIIEGDSIPHGNHRMMMIHMEGDSSSPPHGRHHVLLHDGNHPPHPHHPPGSQVEVNVQHKDTTIDGQKRTMVIRTERIILPEGMQHQPAPPVAPNSPMPPTPPAPSKGDKKPMPAEKQSDLVVYPNPSTAIISVEFDVVAKEKTTLQVIDMNGKVVYTEQIVESESKHLHREINLSGKTKGAYTVEVKTDKKVIAERVILQ